MDLHLPICLQRAHAPVSIRVAQQQRRLKKNEARRPYGGGAAEPRQDLFRDDRLDQKQQERAGEDGDRGEQHGARSNGAAGFTREASHSMRREDARRIRPARGQYVCFGRKYSARSIEWTVMSLTST